MLAIATPEEMRAIDAAALATTSIETLIQRAGSAVARAALAMLGGSYGRRVVVLVGPGNNGADGRVAARRLTDRGVQVRIVEANSLTVLPAGDLVIDAAFGTGFRGSWKAPEVGDARVLAVDIPSGINGLTGEAVGDVLSAERTITFAALKPGLVFGPGAELAGTIQIADVGLDCSHVRANLVQHSDVAGWIPLRSGDAHKWRAATRVVAGSTGMTGAAHLVSSAALRSGAGMVHLSTPGAGVGGSHEYVERPVAATGWAVEVGSDLHRFQALVLGPGLGRDDATVASARELIRGAPVPTVIDGDGLFGLASNRENAAALLGERAWPAVLTPHDGEFGLLAGDPPGRDRIQSVRQLAAHLGVVVLLKGPATVIAEPSGQVLVVTSGDQRLATAGTGDVLSGIIGSLLAQGVPAFHAAAGGAWIHGRAGMLGYQRGLIASDLLDLIPHVLESLL